MAWSRFHSTLEKRVKEAAEARANSLAAGAAEDYAHYQRNVGYIEGLEAALTIADEIEEDDK